MESADPVSPAPPTDSVGAHYTIQRKVFKLVGAGFRIFDATGALVGYCKVLRMHEVPAKKSLDWLQSAQFRSDAAPEMAIGLIGRERYTFYPFVAIRANGRRVEVLD